MRTDTWSPEFVGGTHPYENYSDFFNSLVHAGIPISHLDWERESPVTHLLTWERVRPGGLSRPDNLL
ncbi:MAG TPA: hypothetical protein VGB30_15095 [bacterium]